MELRRQRLKCMPSGPESDRAEPRLEKTEHEMDTSSMSNPAGQNREKVEARGDGPAGEIAKKQGKGSPSDAQMERWAEAVEWFVDHPEAMKDDPLLQAFINHIMEKVAELEKAEASGSEA